MENWGMPLKSSRSLISVIPSAAIGLCRTLLGIQDKTLYVSSVL